MLFCRNAITFWLQWYKASMINVCKIHFNITLASGQFPSGILWTVLYLISSTELKRCNRISSKYTPIIIDMFVFNTIFKFWSSHYRIEIEKIYQFYIGCRLWYQNKIWVPHIIRTDSSNGLRDWLNKRKKTMPFVVPMIWREP